MAIETNYILINELVNDQYFFQNKASRWDFSEAPGLTTLTEINLL